jgi:UPF0716 protein FxsA
MNIRQWLLVALLSLPILEIYLLIHLIGALGFVLTLVLLLSAAALGMSLLRSQGLSTWMRVQHALARGEMPAREMLESGLIGAGGLLLLIPGFLSDILALFCLIPATRQSLALYLLKNYVTVPPQATESGGRLTIDGEFKRDK